MQNSYNNYSQIKKQYKDELNGLDIQLKIVREKNPFLKKVV